MTSVERASCVIAALWLLGTGALFLWHAPPEGTGGMLYTGMALICSLMPPGLAAVGLLAARAIRVTLDAADRIEEAIDTLYHLSRQEARAPAPDDTVAPKLDEILAAQRDIAIAVTELRSDQPAEPTGPAADPGTEPGPAADDDQVALPLDMPAEPPQGGLSRADFIHALNFPETPDDTVGFAALRRAMRDRPAALMIRAAQDILTLMSQDGVYMDDLNPGFAPADVWRRFAGGERGRGIAGLGGVHDQEALDTTARRMKQDAIFRDVAHHFLRLFDRMLTEFAQTATDAEIADLARTRTARAFMLLGRVAGTFD
jgi:hypothetical protein